MDEQIIKEQYNTATVIFFYHSQSIHSMMATPYWNYFKMLNHNNIINGYYVEFIEIDCSYSNKEIDNLMNFCNVRYFPSIILVKDNDEVIQL